MTKSFNKTACEIIAVKVKGIIWDELFGHLAPPVNMNDMKEGYEKVLKFLEEMI